MLNQNEIQKIKEKYRVGMRVRLLIMEDMQAPTIGTEGTVRGDDIGSIMVAWDTGLSLSLIPDEDEFEIIP